MCAAVPALRVRHLPLIAEWKQKAAAIQEIAKQVRLGKDMQLDAAEFVRRAERGLGVAIRDGQAKGHVLSKGQTQRRRNQHCDADQVHDLNCKPRPSDFAKEDELHNSKGTGIYDLTPNQPHAEEDTHAPPTTAALLPTRLPRTAIRHPLRSTPA